MIKRIVSALCFCQILSVTGCSQETVQKPDVPQKHSDGLESEDVGPGETRGDEAAASTPATALPSITLPPQAAAPATHIVTHETHYYLDGPQQARPPDGVLPKGTSVRVLDMNGGYARVQLEDGRVVTVSKSVLRAD